MLRINAILEISKLQHCSTKQSFIIFFTIKSVDTFFATYNHIIMIINLDDFGINLYLVFIAFYINYAEDIQPKVLKQ